MPVFLRVSAASLGAETILLYLARGAGCSLLVGVAIYCLIDVMNGVDVSH